MAAAARPLVSVQCLDGDMETDSVVTLPLAAALLCVSPLRQSRYNAKRGGNVDTMGVMQSRPPNRTNSMSTFVGVHVSDPWLQSQFTQVELRTLKSRFISKKSEYGTGNVTVKDLPPVFAKLKAFSDLFTEGDIREVLQGMNSDMDTEVEFEAFHRAFLDLQNRAIEKSGGSKASFISLLEMPEHRRKNMMALSKFVLLSKWLDLVGFTLASTSRTVLTTIFRLK